ncbi:hypothetical protein MKZ38_007694 [Zalerion maritima]|uniref:Uncharacterized protein n=1 Tax=Zalerion maritima TaxID=339359 RepID=A0AAD5RIR7_9PEZI|nr:hypothetical protein MKZ38_007694 [Zalerion maritima]
MAPPQHQTPAAMKRQSQPQGKQNQNAGTKMEEWNEAKIEQSLDHLKDLHLKVRDLRTAIPRMLEPLTDPQAASPEAMFTEFQKTTTATTHDINSLRDTLNSPQTKSIMTHADQSRAQNPRGIRPWRPRDEPDWADGGR